MTKKGDIWILGDHRLMCADTIHDDISPLFKHKVRLVLTDPPYGVNYVDSKKMLEAVGKDINVKKDIENDEVEIGDYSEFTKNWLEKVVPHLEDYNACYIFNVDLMTCAIRKGMADAKFYFSQTLIWVKNNSVIGRKDYLPQHELVTYGWYGKHKFERLKDKSVIFYPKPTASKLHPTMKPVGLLRKFINNSSVIGDVVFDCFGGSGSTLVACEHLKRKCYMVEVDPVYCDTIVRRWEKLTGRKAILENENA